jgi:hypothetical protein
MYCGSGASIFSYCGMRIQSNKNKKNLQLKIFLSKSCNLTYLSLGLHNGIPSYRRSLKTSRENLQHFKPLNFFTFFPFLWVLFALLDPATQTTADPCVSGSETLISGYNFCSLLVKITEGFFKSRTDFA